MKMRILPMFMSLAACVCLLGTAPAMAAELPENEVSVCEIAEAEDSLLTAQSDVGDGMDLSKDRMTIAMDKTAKIKAFDEDDENVTSRAVWTTSDSRVATVKKGKVTPVSCGTCVISARLDGQKAECTVQIKPGKVEIGALKKDSAGKVEVNWEKMDGVTGYQIWRAIEKDGTYLRVKTASDNDADSYTNTVVKNRKYFYKIRAYYKDKNGKYSYGAWSDVKSIAM